MGTPRRLATEDQMSRPINVEGQDVSYVERERQIGADTASALEGSGQLLSGEDALRTSKHDFEDQNVLVVGGSATAAWAAEHARDGGAAGVEMAAQAPRPRPDGSRPEEAELAARLSFVEHDIRAHLERGEQVPAELTREQHEIVDAHVANQRARLVEIDKSLGGEGGFDDKRQLETERGALQRQLDPFLGARVPRNSDLLADDKVSKVQQDVINVRQRTDGKVEVWYADGTVNTVDRVVQAIGADPRAKGGLVE